jgi:hypothetical protein
MFEAWLRPDEPFYFYLSLEKIKKQVSSNSPGQEKGKLLRAVSCSRRCRKQMAGRPESPDKFRTPTGLTPK